MCQHHWLIEPPHSATSRGICKFCGAVREFRNSFDSYPWEDDGCTIVRTGLLMHEFRGSGMHIEEVARHG